MIPNNIELNESGLEYIMRDLYHNQLYSKEIQGLEPFVVKCLCEKYGVKFREKRMALLHLKYIARSNPKFMAKNAALPNLRRIND